MILISVCVETKAKYEPFPEYGNATKNLYENSANIYDN